MVAPANNVESGNRLPQILVMRSKRRTASNECPPSSKKSSLTPTREKEAVAVPPLPTKDLPPPLPKAGDTPAELQAEEKSSGHEAALIGDVSVSSRSFNPSKGEEIGVYFSLSRKAKVEVAFYDPDFMLIHRFSTDKLLEPGKQTIVWDGRDLDGIVVPDEAYFFTITAKDEEGKKEIYDPIALSGGEGADVIEADVDPYTKVITYKLPAMARVLIRLGVQDGPLLKTLVDWKPRVAGRSPSTGTGRTKTTSLI